MRLFSVFLVMILLVLCNAVSAAEKPKKIDPEKEAESKLMQAEDEAELALSDHLKSEYDGKISLYPVEQGQQLPDVVGTFITSGRIHLLKLTSPTLYTSLLPFNNKDVTMVGKIRANGKYFIAGAVMMKSDGAAPVHARKRGGL